MPLRCLARAVNAALVKLSHPLPAAQPKTATHQRKRAASNAATKQQHITLLVGVQACNWCVACNMQKLAAGPRPTCVAVAVSGSHCQRSIQQQHPLAAPLRAGNSERTMHASCQAREPTCNPAPKATTSNSHRQSHNNKEWHRL
jgi:hypothetical protein